MIFTEKQLELINSDKQEIDFELKDLEIFAIFSLGQMHNKVVRMTDNVFGNTKVGVFTIDKINGIETLDFNNSDLWKNISLGSISLTLSTPNDFGGEDTSTYESLFDIKSIALLK